MAAGRRDASGDESKSVEQRDGDGNGAVRNDSSQTILVVDDEPAILEVAEAMLTSEGYDVVLATNGPEAVERARAEPTRFAAALIDATLPRMDGAETSRQLRRICPHLRILVSSGLDEHEVLRRMGPEPYHGFLKKPYRLDDLLAAVQQAVRG